MATISGASLTIANVNATTVKATVKYTLTPNVIEKLAGTVFSEDIRLIGDDPGVISDVLSKWLRRFSILYMNHSLALCPTRCSCAPLANRVRQKCEVSSNLRRRRTVPFFLG